MPDRPIRRTRKLVVLGMLTKMPVPGVVWQTVHYLLGFERLGFETWYVEAHGVPPLHFSTSEHDIGTARAVAWLETTLGRFGLGHRWAYHALHEDGRVFGTSESELSRLYRSAELLVNLHGGTTPRPEHGDTGRLVYLETDPVRLQVELHHNRAKTIAYLEPHVAFFTFGENYGTPGSTLPVDERFRFVATRQPVVLDLWQTDAPPGTAFTTVGNWRQRGRDVTLGDERYTWSKHHEWRRVMALPSRTKARFELALASCGPDDLERLGRRGWHVVTPAERVPDPDAYRRFIAGSRAEFTMAKDQNVRFRTGWFSDRSATYLASGRAVIAQDTGFGDNLPTGEGLLAFSDLDGAVAAVEAVSADPDRHGKAAADVAREYFDAGAVLGRLLDDVGV